VETSGGAGAAEEADQMSVNVGLIMMLVLLSMLMGVFHCENHQMQT